MFCFRTLNMLFYCLLAPFWWDISFHSNHCSPICPMYVIIWIFKTFYIYLRFFRRLSTMYVGVVFFVFILMDMGLQLWFIKLWLPLLSGGSRSQIHETTKSLNNETLSYSRPWNCKTMKVLGTSIYHETSSLWACKTEDHHRVGLWNEETLRPQDFKTASLKTAKCPCESVRSWVCDGTHSLWAYS